ncbi:MAG: hypothetical protein DDT32_01591 [Syntrophomonadaceae bacterium]|nr:hypothetical protein [Bacillota bacterium]MBT9147825.1 hypothetical protein [Bacillota bacterium]
MADEKEKPLTREDVVRLIEENGGTAKGLDLSRRPFEEGIDLSDLDLRWIVLRDTSLYRAKFNGSTLWETDFFRADLQYAKFNPLNSKPADLTAADLRGAILSYAEFRDADLTCARFGASGDERKAHLDESDLRGARLRLADFEGCFFYGTKLEGAFISGAHLEKADLKEVDWGSYVIGEEKEGHLDSATRKYQWLKTWYTNAGMYDIAGEFFFREMTAKRRALKWWPNPIPRAWSKLVSLICGYGERPFRVAISAAAVIFGFALVYFAFIYFDSGTLTPDTFLDVLYFSTVSFTALGYGQWAPEPTGWVKALGAIQAFVGVFMMALFLITFTRKMTR